MSSPVDSSITFRFVFGKSATLPNIPKSSCPIASAPAMVTIHRKRERY